MIEDKLLQIQKLVYFVILIIVTKKTKESPANRFINSLYHKYAPSYHIS